MNRNRELPFPLHLHCSAPGSPPPGQLSGVAAARAGRTLTRLPQRHPGTDDPMNPFDTASPLDARYYLADADFFRRLPPYTSEAAQIRYLARVEGALALTLADVGVCPPTAAADIARAAELVTPEEVYAEERRIQHN